MTHNISLDEALEELNSAEDFLNYFGIDYAECVVQVNRLHILQRFHDYLQQAAPEPKEEKQRRSWYSHWLSLAYQDFVRSDALTEKVFRIFQSPEPISIPLTALLQGTSLAMVDQEPG